jgi:hypothetical protein
LVGPARLHGARSQVGGRTDDNRCPLVLRGGERRQRPQSGRTRAGWSRTSPTSFEDTSFARSRDPCTSISTELPWREPCEVERSIRYRGRATSRKWEEPAPGPGRTDDCAARRVGPLSESTPRGRASHVRKGRWSWPSSLRGNESPEPSARTSEYVAGNRQAASWPRISSHAALQKEWRCE